MGRFCCADANGVDNAKTNIAKKIKRAIRFTGAPLFAWISVEHSRAGLVVERALRGGYPIRPAGVGGCTCQPANMPAFEVFARTPDEIGWETFDLLWFLPFTRLEPSI